MKTKECRLLAGTIAVLCAMVQLASAQTPAALDREATFAAARTGKWEVAEAPLTKLADGHPADADACALLAQRRQQQNRAKDAVELMERAVAAQPNRADLQAQLGDALGQRMGEVGFFQRPLVGGKMREAFERSIALDPLHVPALIGLTKCCLYAPAIGGGSAAKAEEYARRAQKLDPVYGSYWLGQTLERQERWSDAAQAYRQGLATQDQHGWLYGNLGSALAKAGQKDAARGVRGSVETPTRSRMGAQSAGGAWRRPGGAVGGPISSPFSQPPFDRFRPGIGEEAFKQLRALT